MVRAAKKRKKEEDEGFSLPEFDEAAYLRKEVMGAKVSLVIITLAVPVAGLLYAVTALGLPVVAFFLGLGLTFLVPRVLRFLPWPKLNLEAFERRDWIGHGGTFLFSWLAFWILFLNVPFVDVTAPVVTQVTVFAGGDAVAPREGASLQADVTHAPGNDTAINATVFENDRLESVRLYVDTVPYEPTSVSGARYRWVLALVNGQHDISIVAEDASGHTREFAFSLNLIPR